MVSNHSLKQQSRELAEKLKISYTQALEIIKTREAMDLRENLSPRQILVAKDAAEAIRNGFNVLIYGGSGSGKTSMIHAVMDNLSGYPRILMTSANEPGLKTEDSLYSKLQLKLRPEEVTKKELESFHVGAMDELRGSLEAEAIGLFRERPVIASIHAMSAAHALSRASLFSEMVFPSQDWSYCYLLHCQVDPETRARTASLYESPSEEERVKNEGRDYSTQLRAMSDSLLHVLSTTDEVLISEALKAAGAFHGTTSSQMKYALSFAHTKRYVEIDYDEGTVIRLP